jgi:broad specificity phosphatase PhoE
MSSDGVAAPDRAARRHPPLMRIRLPSGSRCGHSFGDAADGAAMPHPTIYLARHGETEWSLSGQHTSLTDLPLTPHGEELARKLAPRLEKASFAKVFTSPLQRARRTCELAGFGAAAEIMPDLVEWNYGAYEGVRTRDIHADRPDWDLFKHGAPGGESVEQVTARSARVIARLRAVDGDVLCFSSGHFLRALAGSWLGFGAAGGRLLYLGTTSLSALGYEHSLDEPVIRFWNDTAHLDF